MRKVLSILNWALVMIVSLLGFVSAPFIFPLYYVLRNTKIVKYFIPLWYYGDDEDGVYGADYWKIAKGIKKDTFWTAYKWSALRNPAWNLMTVLVPKAGDEVYVSHSGGLSRNGIEISPDNVAVIMYEDMEEKWMHNSGDVVSLKYSKIGKVMYWFTIEGKLYWRYSYVGKPFRNIWFEIQLGVGNRYTFRFKFKKQ